VTTFYLTHLAKQRLEELAELVIEKKDMVVYPHDNEFITHSFYFYFDELRKSLRKNFKEERFDKYGFDQFFSWKLVYQAYLRIKGSNWLNRPRGYPAKDLWERAERYFEEFIVILMEMTGETYNG